MTGELTAYVHPSADRVERLKRARRSLDGLSPGDGFGGLSSLAPVRARKLPAGTWSYADDMYMALSIYSILRQHGQIDQDALAFDFAIHFDATRGFGLGMRRLLPAMLSGTPWQEGARKLYKGAVRIERSKGK